MYVILQKHFTPPHPPATLLSSASDKTLFTDGGSTFPFPGHQPSPFHLGLIMQITTAALATFKLDLLATAQILEGAPGFRELRRCPRIREAWGR